jgi:ATP-dependent helicase/nuclease subunit A
MRLADEFETREGRDLRGLLDFLATRAETGDEAQAATAAEGHDGVRIMTVHNAKGLEFGVVAVPDLARSLLAGTRPPLLSLGRETEPRVGLQLRRLGAASINLYSHAELCEEEKRRDAEEGLRLFHVAATRAREHLILSGVVKAEGSGETKPATPVIERIADGLGIDREADSFVAIPPPGARAGLDATFPPSEIAVRVNLPSPARAGELAVTRRAAEDEWPLGEGPPPLVRRRPPAAPDRPLSYTAIAAFEDGADRRQMERAPDPADREERAAHGVVVHSLLEWSQANGWAEPPAELARRHALAVDLDPADREVGELLVPVRAWLGSPLFAERIAPEGTRQRAEVPLLLQVEGTVLRGSIDLLVEREGAAPLVVDYKTDCLDNATPAEHVARYAIQRDIYALAVAEARQASQVDMAYVFLERPEEPLIETLGKAEIAAGRERIAAAIERIRAAAQEAPSSVEDVALPAVPAAGPGS